MAPGFAHLADQAVNFFECGQVVVDVHMQQTPHDVAIQFIEVGGQIAAFVEIQGGQVQALDMEAVRAEVEAQQADQPEQ